MSDWDTDPSGRDIYQDTVPDAPLPKRPLRRRILKWLLWTVAILLLLVALGIGFLHTGWGKDFVRGKVESALTERFDGEVALGELDYALLGDLRVGGLRVAPKGSTAEAAPVLGLKGVDVVLDWGSLLSGHPVIEELRVDGLELNLVAYPDGTTNLKRMLKQQSKPPEALTVEHFEATSIQVTITRPDGSVTKVRDLSAAGDLSFVKAPLAVSANLDSLALQVAITRPDGSITTVKDLTGAGKVALAGSPLKVNADLTTLAMDLTIDRPGVSKVHVPLSMALSAAVDGEALSASIPAITTKATVTRPGVAPMVVPVNIGETTVSGTPTTASLRVARTVVGPLTIEEIVGRLNLKKGAPTPTLEGAQQLKVSGLSAAAKSLNSLLGQELLLSDIRADVEVSGPPQAMVLDGRVATAGGVFAAKGNANVADPMNLTYDVTFTGKDIDSTKLVNRPDAPSVKTSMTLTAKGRGFAPGAATANVRFELGKTEINGTPIDGLVMRASAEGNTFTLDGLQVTAFGQTVGCYARVDADRGHLVGKINTKSGLADVIARARDAGVMLPPLPPLQGELDVDLTIEAQLAPGGIEKMRGLQAKVASGAVVDARDLPLDMAKITGFIRGKGVRAADRSVGALDMAVDLQLAKRVPSGHIQLQLSDLNVVGASGPIHLDSVNARVDVSGDTQRITLAARDAAQGLAVDTALTAEIDLERRAVRMTVHTLDLKRRNLATRLLAPITLAVDQGMLAPGTQTLTIPSTRLALAGGEVSLAGQATITRDPNHPEATALQRFDVSFDAQSLDLAKLAALANRPARATGRFTGHVEASGTVSDPSVRFSGDVTARARGLKPVRLKARGSLLDRLFKVTADVIAPRTNTVVATLRARAPVVMGPKPGLAPNGRLGVTLEMPPISLGRLSSLLPRRLPKGIDRAAKVSGSLSLEGSPRAPRGDFDFDIAGKLLPESSDRQRIALGGKIGTKRVDATLSGWLDTSADKTLSADVTALFARSPLLPGTLRRPFTVKASLSPLDLAALPPRPGAPKLGGSARGDLTVRVARNDLAGDGAFKLSGITVERPGQDPLPPTDTELTFGLSDTAITVGAAVKALLADGEMALVNLAGDIGVGGKGLRRKLKRPKSLAKQVRGAPVSLKLSAPTRTLSELARLSPKLAKAADFPGKLSMAMAVGGTVGAPRLDGGLRYHDFTTLDGSAGQVALSLAGGLDALNAQLGLGVAAAGGTPPVSVNVDVVPQQLLDKQPATATLAARASAVQLLSLVPDFAVKGERLDVSGLMDWAMDGTVVVAPVDGGYKPDIDATKLSGTLDIRDVAFKIPGERRQFHSLGLQLEALSDGIALNKLTVREDDVQKKNRSLDMTGKLTWDGFVPQAANLRIKTDDFLVLGMAFDGPEGELDLDLEVQTTQLLEPVKKVDVIVHSVNLLSPDRFVRMHYHQLFSHGDVLEVGDGIESGKLPVQAPLVLPEPPTAEQLESEPGADISIRIPDPIRVGFFPLDIKLQGRLDATMRGEALGLTGKLNVVEGTIDAMGRLWDLEEGAISAPGPLSEAGAKLSFRRRPHELAQRDLSMPSANDGYVRIFIEADAKRGLVNYFGGAVGPMLLDVATILNTGRVTFHGDADNPVSSNVQFGNHEAGLVASFIQTNLRHLMFMDRANGWSEALDDPAVYGQIAHFLADRFIADNGSRIRFQRRPFGIGQNNTELGYDVVLDHGARSTLAAGVRLGGDLNGPTGYNARAGLGLFWEWSSEE